MIEPISVTGFKYAVVEMGRRSPLILEIKNIEAQGDAIIIYDVLGNRTWVHASRVMLTNKLP